MSIDMVYCVHTELTVQTEVNSLSVLLLFLISPALRTWGAWQKTERNKMCFRPLPPSNGGLQMTLLFEMSQPHCGSLH